MDKRRNSYTAVLFLAGLAAAMLYLVLGLAPSSKGFREVARSGRPVPQALCSKDPTPKEEARERPPARSTVRPLQNSLSPSLPSLEESLEAFSRFTQEADPALNQLLDRDHGFIELYGGIQRLLGRRIVEDTDPQYTVVKLEGELLTFAELEGEQMDMTTRAEEMAVSDTFPPGSSTWRRKSPSRPMRATRTAARRLATSTDRRTYPCRKGLFSSSARRAISA